MKKFRLIATSLAFTLVLAIMAFGVYAAASPSFTISNQILFTPQTGQARFSAVLSTQAKADEAASYSVVNIGENESVTIATDPAKPEAEIPAAQNAQTLSNFNFATNHFYKIILVVTNTNGDNGKLMNVTISGLPTQTGFTITPSSNMTAISSNSTELSVPNHIENGESTTIELVYQITSFTTAINVSQSLTVTMSIAAPV